MSDDDDLNPVNQSKFAANFKHSRFLSRSACCSDGSDDDDDKTREPKFYEDIDIDNSNSTSTEKKKKRKQVDLPDKADDRASDVASDAANNDTITTTKTKKKATKTAGSKRDRDHAADDNDNDDDDTDVEKEANKKDKSAYQKELLQIECDNFTDLVIEEVTVLQQKIMVPREYTTTVSDILDPTLVTLSNAWIKEHISTETLKEKKPSAQEKAAAIVVFKLATERDITHHLKQKCNKESTSKDMSDFIKLRLMRTHFKFALFLHIGQLLQNAAQIHEYFSSNTSDDKFPHKKKGKEVSFSRKSIKDTFRRRFEKIFDADWFKLQMQRHITLLAVESDKGDEEEADLSSSSGAVTSSSKIEEKQIKSKIHMQINKGTTGQFIELYLSIISKHQEKHLKQIKTSLYDSKHTIGCLKTLLCGNNNMEVEILLEDLQNQSDRSIKYYNGLLCDTTLGKVGVTTENNASWQNRMNTCNISPNHKKFECLHVPFSTENAKIIEAYPFAVLQHFGLKTSNTKTKSSQGEFFRLYIEIEEIAECVQHDIETILEHCSSISEEHFNEWTIIYKESKLSDLKNVSNWRFSSDIIAKYFDIPHLSNQYSSYYSEHADRIECAELDLNEIEENYLCVNDPAVSSDVQIKPAKGLGLVISKYSGFLEPSDNSNDNANAISQKASERSKTGIFLKSTVELLVEEVVSKAEVGVYFKVCIIGIHCVVSISRLILQFESVCIATEFSYTIIEISEKKIDALLALLSDSTREIKINFIKDNFLFIPNYSLQNQNIIMCFLNASSTRTFALKFILLQCYCDLKNSRGLQKVLCSQRILLDANSAFVEAQFRKGAVTMELAHKVVVYGYNADTIEYSLRDLYIIRRIRNIVPLEKKKLLEDSEQEIWIALERTVWGQISLWGENSLSVLNLIDPLSHGCLKRVSDFDEPVFHLGNRTGSKLIDIVTNIKKHLIQCKHDEDIAQLQLLIQENPGHMETKVLIAKLNKRIVKIFANMQKCIIDIYKRISAACGCQINSDMKFLQAIKNFQAKILKIQSDLNLPTNPIVEYKLMSQLEYTLLLQSGQNNKQIIATWVVTIEKENTGKVVINEAVKTKKTLVFDMSADESLPKQNDIDDNFLFYYPLTVTNINDLVLTVYAPDVARLGNAEYLNDILIDLGIKEVIENYCACKSNPPLRVYAYTSLFYGQLTGNRKGTNQNFGYIVVSKLTKHVNIFDMEINVIVINFSNRHWCVIFLVDIGQEDKAQIWFMDNLVFNGEIINDSVSEGIKVSTNICKYLTEEWKNKQVSKGLASRTFILNENVTYIDCRSKLPKQEGIVDAINCGIYVLFDISAVLNIFHLFRQDKTKNILDLLDINMFTSESVDQERVQFAARLENYAKQWETMSKTYEVVMQSSEFSKLDATDFELSLKNKLSRMDLRILQELLNNYEGAKRCVIGTKTVIATCLRESEALYLVQSIISAGSGFTVTAVHSENTTDTTDAYASATNAFVCASSNSLSDNFTNSNINSAEEIVEKEASSDNNANDVFACSFAAFVSSIDNSSADDHFAERVQPLAEPRSEENDVVACASSACASVLENASTNDHFADPCGKAANANLAEAMTETAKEGRVVGAEEQ